MLLLLLLLCHHLLLSHKNKVHRDLWSNTVTLLLIGKGKEKEGGGNRPLKGLDLLVITTPSASSSSSSSAVSGSQHHHHKDAHSSSRRAAESSAQQDSAPHPAGDTYLNRAASGLRLKPLNGSSSDASRDCSGGGGNSSGDVGLVKVAVSNNPEDLETLKRCGSATE